ncbi:MAG TPA: radical SAM protein [Planctomycetes bacterium]|nr:radical SAM protein [Planctomycetota bacterium]
MKLLERLFRRKPAAGGCDGDCRCGSKGPRTNPGPARPDLSWVAEWIERVREYIWVRAEDEVLIQRPNKAVKLNPSAVRLLGRLLAGESIDEILAPYGADPAPWRDTERFLLDVRKLLKDGLPDTYASPAVEKVPFTMDFSPLPVLSEVAVTYRCNAACVFCYAGCNCTANPVGNADEMSLAEVKQVLDRLVDEAKVPSVSFTGGEATLRPDLPDMIRHARARGMRVNLISNGITSASPAYARKLAEAGLHSAQISIEGTTAEVHEAVTAIPGSFAKALAGLRNLREAGVRVHTNTTILRTNVHDVAAFPRFVKEVLGNAAFSMNLVIPTGSAPVNGGLEVPYTEIGPILVEIAERSAALGVEFMWYSPTPMCIFNPIVHGLGNKGCSACDGLISVGADGQVLPCASYDEPVGDFLREGFAAVWQSARAKELRNKGEAHPACRACEQFEICHGACPLYWRAMGFGELDAVHGRAPQPARRALPVVAS